MSDLHKVVNGRKIPLTDAEIAEYGAREAQWNADKPKRDRQEVAEKRRSEYPSVGDQLDAIYKHFESLKLTFDETSELGKIIEIWKQVKLDNPYPAKDV